jgi:hypothetical protein
MELRALKTWYSNRDGWVTLEDDVLSIVRQTRDLFGKRITVECNPHNGDYVFVEHCDDGTDRLIFTTRELDGRCIERLLRADSQGRTYQDPYDAAERAQDDQQRAIDEYYRGYIGEAGAHLAHAMKREGMAPSLPLTKSMYVPAKAEKEAERADAIG